MAISKKVCLVIMFNSRFDENLPLLRRIYGKRFSNIRFLVPFYDGKDKDVIPVYECSFQFQGYFIQAYEKLKKVACSHYLFLGDDAILNPDFNENNVLKKMDMLGYKFGICQCGLPGYRRGAAGLRDEDFVAPPPPPPVPGMINSPNAFRWGWTALSSRPFIQPSLNDWQKHICKYDEALLKFKDFFGVDYKEFYEEEFWGSALIPGYVHFRPWGGIIIWNNPNEFVNVVRKFIIEENGNTNHIPYPMAFGYSDIFCIEKESLFEFSRLCGIFSAMNMLVEIAIPTAMVLTFKSKDVKFFPVENTNILWFNDRVEFENKYNLDFNKLYTEWEEKIYFVHPVKLSRWSKNY